MSGVVVASIARTATSTTPPDAVNWADISFAAGGSGNNADQTVSGLNGTLAVFWVGDAFGTAGGVLKYSLNGGAYTTLAASTAITVVNTNTLNWQANLGSPGGEPEGPYTIGIRYGASPGTLWDTFTVTAT